MRILSFLVAAFGLASLGLTGLAEDRMTLLLGAVALICAFTTFRAQGISSFLKIFIAIFSIEVVVFGTGVMLSELGLWPPSLKEYGLPVSLPLTVAVFSILVYAISHVPVIATMTRIADRFFETSERTMARIWPFSSFGVTEHRLARAMVTFLVLVNQAEVAINVRLSFFNRDWFNALQAKDAKTFWLLLFTVFLPWAAIFIAAAVLEYVVQSMLIIRWRRWLTHYYIAHWLDGPTHYKMSLRANNFDNPDQRISEDVARFLDGGNTGGYGIYSYSIVLISTLSSLVSFGIVLFYLSANFTIPGTDIAVPGFLFWVALVYAGLGTFITHRIGWPLATLFFQQQRYEADFRFSLVRVREYSEQVALLAGEPVERRTLMDRFGWIFANYLAIVNRRKKLVAFTNAYEQISQFIPYIVAAPFYFAGKIELGIMTQTAQAFGQVTSALNFFVTYYTSLADFRAVLARLSTFDEAIESCCTGTTAAPIAHIPSKDNAVALADLTLDLPDGRVVLAPSNVTFEAHQAALIVGPSGSGKSTLLRAISGIWPYGRGRVMVPAGASLMIVPQKPYLPIGSLRAAIAYPADGDTYSEAELRAALAAAELPDYLERLDEDDNWGQRLSGGEQQRVAIARALLAKPDWLFLDEATAALDEASEAALYRALAEHLPQTTVVSIGHRSTLAAFHKRRVELTPDSDGTFAAREADAAKAAE